MEVYHMMMCIKYYNVPVVVFIYSSMFYAFMHYRTTSSTSYDTSTDTSSTSTSTSTSKTLQIQVQVLVHIENTYSSIKYLVRVVR
jgi:hypothetical protein